MAFVLLNNQLVPIHLRGGTLVDSVLPRYWANVWKIVSLAHLAESTQIAKLRYVEDLYQHADEVLEKNSFDDALADLDEEAIATALESWFVSIRNQAQVTRADEREFKYEVQRG